MKELIAFISRYSKWLVLLFYTVISLMLLFRSDPFRHHLWLTSANTVSGAFYKVGHNITTFFSLKQVNEDLNARNAVLEAEVVNLRDQINTMRLAGFTDTMPTPDSVSHFNFIVANVINNSIHHPYNYITIDRGSLDGVKPEMGVIDHSGVVGTISAVGPHFSRVISLLNPNFRLSCKIKGSENFGSLVWDGIAPDEALLEELPRHTVYATGDTIITSGYSAVFPAGLPVGTIIDDGVNHNQNFFTLRIKLFADFARLSNVQVVVDNYRDELLEVEANTIVNSDPTKK
ncbi:MAG: rod shape-determining protein MreC [Muribaculaceae bacterium]|nr:rod shape-determining protein MreC [Muribaculaceae bacterium]